MTDAEKDAIVKRLIEPFEVRDVKWRITNTTSDKRRGVVMPYADPRAYKDRLNEVLTTGGWSESYSVTVLEHSIRRNGERSTEMIAGKILVTCKVAIPGIGEHSGTGEEWSDADCAMTSADAQAFKRACSSFGLGRYLYSVPQQWVDLDQKKRPKSLPMLPNWARPARKEQGGQATNQRGSEPKGEVILASNNAERATRQQIEAIESYRAHLGDALYSFHLTQYANVRVARKIRDAATAEKVLNLLSRTGGGLLKARQLAENISVDEFDRVLNKLRIETLDTIPHVATLINLVRELEGSGKRAA